MPGAHNALNAAAALTAMPRDRRRRRGRRGRAARLLGRRAALRAPRHDRRRARSWSTTTRTTRPRCARRSRPPARSSPRRLVARLPAAPLLAHARSGARVRRRARRSPTSPVVTEIYPARERAEDFPGVTGRLVAEAAADAGGGRRVAWLPDFDAAERFLRARAARGRPAADARRGRHRRARAGGWPVRVEPPEGEDRSRRRASVARRACSRRRLALAPRLLAVVARSATSSSPAVSSAPRRPRSAARSKTAALDMTTLHVREDALRAAVAQYPSVAGIRRRRRLPAQAHDRGARARAGRRDRERRRAASRPRGDGRVLRGAAALAACRSLRVRSAPAGERVTDRDTLGALAVAGGAPPELRGADRAPVVRPARPDARPAQRPGPRLRLRRGRRAQVGGGRPGARRSELRGRHLPRPAGARTRWPQAGSDRSSREADDRPSQRTLNLQVESRPTLDP